MIDSSHLHIMDNLCELQRKYLSMYQIKKLKGDISGQMPPEIQINVLQVTIRHERSRQYPPSLKYRKLFLKMLLDKLEESGTEICDDLYEEYTSLISVADTDTECFKTFTLADCEVTVKENQQLISDGTTGLCTWQAAQHLAEWALENRIFFQNRYILELGSGLGLAGMMICKLCQPNKYIFSDCHKEVLQRLSANIALNMALYTDEERKPCELTDEQLSKSHNECSNNDRPLYNLSHHDISEKYWTSLTENRDKHVKFPTMSLDKDNRVFLCPLDWEHFEKEDITTFHDVDTILAADVVYDPSIIPWLVNILYLLLDKKLSSGDHPVAFIASTVRNLDTQDLFKRTLDSTGISVEKLPPPTHQYLFYDRTLPIEIIKLRAKKGTRLSTEDQK